MEQNEKSCFECAIKWANNTSIAMPCKLLVKRYESCSEGAVRWTNLSSRLGLWSMSTFTPMGWSSSLFLGAGLTLMVHFQRARETSLARRRGGSRELRRFAGQNPAKDPPNEVTGTGSQQHAGEEEPPSADTRRLITAWKWAESKSLHTLGNRRRVSPNGSHDFYCRNFCSGR